jgi:hypothetical protein
MESKSMYKVNAGDYYPIKVDGSSVVKDLPLGTYTAGFHPNLGYYLTSGTGFSLPAKVYGLSNSRTARILRTFEDRSTISTGVLLIGEKGSGKTLLAKSISCEALKKGYPTIVVSTALFGAGFNDFVSMLPPSVVLFDEFEKVYDKDEQKELLTLLDGVVNTHKLFILTANDKYSIDSHMSNRPGRIFYYLEYGGIDDSIIKDFCQDKLNDKAHISEILSIAKYIGVFTFDMLSCLVEETNRQQCRPAECLDMLNIKEDTWASYDRTMVPKVILNDYKDFVVPDDFIHSVRTNNNRLGSNDGHILSSESITVTIGAINAEGKGKGLTPSIKKWFTDHRFEELTFDTSEHLVSYDSASDTYNFHDPKMNISLQISYAPKKRANFRSVCGPAF